MPARPILGPDNYRKYEAELAALDGIGLNDHDMDILLAGLADRLDGRR